MKRRIMFFLLLALILPVIGCDSGDIQTEVTAPAEKAVISSATYRGDQEHTGNYGNGEVEFPAVEKWKFFNTEKGIWSAPAYANRMVFFGSLDRHLYALDAESGDVKWNFETGASITSAPAVDNGAVFFGSWDGNFYALDCESGNELWSFETSTANDATESESLVGFGENLSPIVVDGIVYFGSIGKKLYALERDSGKKLWEYETSSEITGSPAYHNGYIYFTGPGKLYALNTESGELAWERDTENALGGTPSVSNNVVLLSNVDSLAAYDNETGEVSWEKKIGSEGVAIKGETVFTCDQRGYYALDMNTGEEKWQKLSYSTGCTGIPPSIAGNSVYFIDTAANIRAFAIDNGDSRGVYGFQESFKPAWATPTPIVIANGVIYVGSLNGNLYAIEGE